MYLPAEKQSFITRWTFAIVVSLIFSANHYSRDTPGAIEKQLETDIEGFTPKDYSMINSLYFFPNMITPLFAGMLIEKLGGIHNSFLISVSIAAIGHVLFAFGVQYDHIPTIFVGKVISGSMYEIIDCVMAVTYMAPVFQDDYQVIVSIQQFFVRLGSVINFFLSPWIYTHYGLNTSIWVSSLIGASSIGIFLIAWALEYYYLRDHTTTTVQDSSSETVQSTHPTSLADIEEVKVYPESSTSITAVAVGKLEEEQNPFLTCAYFPLLNPFLHFLCDYTAIHHLSMQYHCYAIAGSCLYGCIVPFWFCGSKYLQDMFAMDVSIADSIMTIPESMIIIVGIPIGIIIGRYKWSSILRGNVFAGSLVTMGIGYLILILTATLYNHQPPSQATTATTSSTVPAVPLLPLSITILAVVIIGAGFAFGCQLFWGSINHMAPGKYLSQAVGLISCEVNILPSIIPPCLASIQHTLHTSERMNDQMNVSVLMVIACVGAIFAWLSNRYDQDDLTFTSSSSSGGGSRKVVEGGGYTAVATKEDEEEEEGEEEQWVVEVKKNTMSVVEVVDVKGEYEMVRRTLEEESR